jgi:hypothetical protein
MKKVVALIAASIVSLIAPPWIRYYGVAFELRNVPPERRAFELDITTIDIKYMLIELLSVPLAILLLLAAIGIYIYERKKNNLIA